MPVRTFSHVSYDDIFIVSASSSPPGHNGSNGLIVFCFVCKRFVQNLGPFWTHFDHFGTLLGSLLHLWAHFWSTRSALFVSKNKLGSQRCPKTSKMEARGSKKGAKIINNIATKSDAQTKKRDVGHGFCLRVAMAFAPLFQEFP